MSATAAAFPAIHWPIDVDPNARVNALPARDGVNKHIFLLLEPSPCGCVPSSHRETMMVEAMLHEQVTMHDVLTELGRAGYAPSCATHCRLIGLRELCFRPGHYELIFEGDVLEDSCCRSIIAAGLMVAWAIGVFAVAAELSSES